MEGGGRHEMGKSAALRGRGTVHGKRESWRVRVLYLVDGSSPDTKPTPRPRQRWKTGIASSCLFLSLLSESPAIISCCPLSPIRNHSLLLTALELSCRLRNTESRQPRDPFATKFPRNES